MATTPAECLDALRAAADRLGESPSKAQYEGLGLTPSSATVIRVFGGWNAAKQAAGQETSSSTGTRVEGKPENVDFTETEWRNLSVDQRWHHRNVAYNSSRSLVRRARLRAWVFESKRDGSCVRCGESDPACLDFHHVDDEEKHLSIGRMVSNGYAREKIATEMEKCDLLCANCHRKEHHDVPRFARSGGGDGRGTDD